MKKQRKRRRKFSDNRTRFKEFETRLEKLSRQPKENFALNSNILATMISGIVGSKNMQLPLIVSKVPRT